MDNSLAVVAEMQEGTEILASRTTRAASSRRSSSIRAIALAFGSPLEENEQAAVMPVPVPMSVLASVLVLVVELVMVLVVTTSTVVVADFFVVVVAVVFVFVFVLVVVVVASCCPSAWTLSFPPAFHHPQHMNLQHKWWRPDEQRRATAAQGERPRFEDACPMSRDCFLFPKTQGKMTQNRMTIN